MGDELTGMARIPAVILERASELGLDRAELMRAASLDPAELADPDARTRVSKHIRLWRAIMERSDDPGIGLRIGRSVGCAQLGVVGYAMCHSSTLGRAYERLARFCRVLSEAVRFGITPAADRFRLTMELHPGLQALRAPIDAYLTTVIDIGRQITDVRFTPAETHIPIARPADAARYARLFGGIIRYRQPTAALVFSSHQWHLPLVAADPALGSYLEELAQIALKSVDVDGGTLIRSVRHALWPQLSGGKPDLSRTAGRLGISRRTLQRRLKEEGRSFAAVLDRLRHELALELLQDRRTSLGEVAVLLGYSEPSSFHRAFRRWTGMAPRQYRARFADARPGERSA